MFRKFMLTAMVAVVAPAISEAGFTLTVSDGANNYGSGVVSVNGQLQQVQYNNFDLTSITGYQSGTLMTLGTITVTDALGTYTISATLVNNNTNGSASGSMLALSSAFVYFTAANPNTASSSLTTPLTITLTGSGYNLPQNPVTASVTSSANFSSNTGTTGTAMLSSTFNAQTIQTETVNANPKTDNTTGGSLTSSYTDTFTLTDTLSITGLSSGFNNGLQNGSINSFVATVTPAPAPAGLVMVAGALPFAGLLRLRRRKVEVATAV